MLIIPAVVFFILGWRVGGNGRRFGAKHAIGLLLFGCVYAVAAVDAYSKRTAAAGLDPSSVLSMGNLVYAFGYGAGLCGGAMLFGGWLGNRRRIKKALGATSARSEA